MKRLEVMKYLFDIKESCVLLLMFSKNKTLDDYLRDTLLRSAVERQFEIIGEAVKRVLDIDPHLEPKISNSGKIIAFRNRLIHGYASVSDEVVWGILKSDLLTLQKEVNSLLKKFSAM